MSEDLVIREERTPDNTRERFDIMRRIVQWADEVGPAFRAELQRQAPIGDPLTDTHPGRLRGSIRYKRETSAHSIRVTWSANVPYASYVIHGTGPHDIYPVAALALHFRDAEGAECFAQVTHHRGAKADDFPKRAREFMGARMDESFRAAVRGNV